MTSSSDPQGPDDLISVGEAAKVLGLGRHWFHVLRKRGVITPTVYYKATSTRGWYSRAEIEALRDQVRAER